MSFERHCNNPDLCEECYGRERSRLVRVVCDTCGAKRDPGPDPAGWTKYIVANLAIEAGGGNEVFEFHRCGSCS